MYKGILPYIDGVIDTDLYTSNCMYGFHRLIYRYEVRRHGYDFICVPRKQEVK